MKFEIEINGKHYSFTKWLRIIIAMVFLVAIAIDIWRKDWNGVAIDALFLIAVIQGNQISDLEDQVEKLKGE